MVALNQIGQIALTVDDVDVAEEFYGATLGLKKLFRYGDWLFFDCAGVRLLIERSGAKPFVPQSSILYFRTPDLRVSYPQLKASGVSFIDAPHLIAPMPDHDLWMVFFKDPAGNILALMQEAPKGFAYSDDEALEAG